MPEKDELIDDLDELSFVDDNSNNFDNDDLNNKIIDFNNYNNSSNQDVNGLNNKLIDNSDQQNNNVLNNPSNQKELNNNKDYKKASSGREAFNRSLNDRNYYKNKKNEAAERLKNAKTNLANKKKSQDSAKKKVSDDKEKLVGSNNDIEKKENNQELKDAKKEEKSSLKDTLGAKKELGQSKKDLFNAKKDSLKSKAFAAKNPVEAAKMVAIKFLKKIRNLLLIKVVLPVTIIVLLIVILISSIFEVFDKVDQVMTGVANFQEKLDNFLNGLGFNDSEQAFYNEIDDLNKKYNNAIDVPLLMATIFYDDIKNGLDPEDDMVSTALVEEDSDNDFFLVALAKKTIVKWYTESNVTVGKDGLRYTSNKIYRLRKLAGHQFTDSKYTPETISLGRYLSKYFLNLGEDVLSLIKDAIVYILNSIFNIGNTIESLKEVLFDDEDFFMTDTGALMEKLFNDIVAVFKDIFGGLFTPVTDISFFCSTNEVDLSTDGYVSEATEEHGEIHLVCVTHKVHTKYDVDEEAYFKYLKEEYIPRMPEFQKELMGIAKNTKQYDEAIDDIISNIKVYRDSYNDYYKTSDQTENIKKYTNRDKGNIKPLVINSLTLPVEVAEGFTPNISGNNAYGYGSGTSLNKGIYLNETTIGARAGDNVYSVYDGEVTALPDSNSSSNNNTKSYDNMLFLGDSRYVGISNELKALGSNIYVAAVGSSLPSDFIKLTEEGYGHIQTTHDSGDFALPSNVSNVSIMLGVNSLDQTKALQTVVENLHKRYPRAIVYINSVYNLGEPYNNYKDKNQRVKDFNDTMKLYAADKSYAKYIDITFGINDDSTGLKSSYTRDGVHLNQEGNSVLLKNLMFEISGNASNDNLVIRHIMMLNGTKYEFYTQYGEIDIDESIKVGTEVKKGQKIGVINSSGSLYFEFDESTGEALNPIGLYVKNYSVGLTGNTNAEKIFNYFIDNGYSVAGTCGMMGNISSEAYPAFEPNSIEITDWKTVTNHGYTSQQFTDLVDSGSVTYDEFLASERFGIYSGNRYGYGLAGFTALDIKKILWSNTVEQGASIADLYGQLKTIEDSMNLRRANLKTEMQTETNVKNAALLFSVYYEGCSKCKDESYCGTQYRIARANSIYNYYVNNNYSITGITNEIVRSGDSSVDTNKCIP